jgi:transposase
VADVPSGLSKKVQICFKLGKAPKETHEMLRTVYADDGLSSSSVSEWFKRFNDGHEDLQYDPRSGRPSTTRNAYIIVKW